MLIAMAVSKNSLRLCTTRSLYPKKGIVLQPLNIETNIIATTVLTVIMPRNQDLSILGL